MLHCLGKDRFMQPRTSICNQLLQLHVQCPMWQWLSKWLLQEWFCQQMEALYPF